MMLIMILAIIMKSMMMRLKILIEIEQIYQMDQDTENGGYRKLNLFLLIIQFLNFDFLFIKVSLSLELFFLI
jgi:hypothetical protein